MIIVNPISPVAFSIGPLAVRWYALAYIAAFIVGFWLFKKLTGKSQDKKYYDDLLTAVILGTIIGGRLGYVLFYNLPFFLAHPLEIFAVWHGGMSFHGGLLGVLISVFLFAIQRTKGQKDKRSMSICPSVHLSFSILDTLTVVGPIGLFFGRIANFINMEVMGRATTSRLGVVFAGTEDLTPRYPSPLFEAALEGVALFVIMLILWRFTDLRRRTGALSGIFAMLYAVFRIFAEQFRQPDAQIGFLTSWGLTMGQLLSAGMFIAGAVIFAVALRKK
ncbi:MAG: prolipoprotein diacylglyceryl transferase [Rickettsiales bacterium]|jgi:phosphatidylglycerol:prolipoprotein diacylglycerol transferase|nr:prolipoprotein diacylglyceryl transferase [Rickettsiales bacterium]